MSFEGEYPAYSRSSSTGYAPASRLRTYSSSSAGGAWYPTNGVCGPIDEFEKRFGGRLATEPLERLVNEVVVRLDRLAKPVDRRVEIRLAQLYEPSERRNPFVERAPVFFGAPFRRAVILFG